MATTEVAQVLSSVPGNVITTATIYSIFYIASNAGFSDVAVYGVEVPGCDGKVGMACVVLTDGLQHR